VHHEDEIRGYRVFVENTPCHTDWINNYEIFSIHGARRAINRLGTGISNNVSLQIVGILLLSIKELRYK